MYKFRVWDKTTNRFIQNDKDDVCFFTGLKDSKEIEIYEGDIITYRVCGMDKEGKYSNDFIGFIIFRNGRFDIQFSKTKLSTQYHYLDAADKVKVIGNIYENKELL